MLQRTSNVDQLKIESILLSSIIEIGDANYIQGFSRALAIQRQAEIFFGNEGNFDQFPVFTAPLSFQPIEDKFSMYIEQLHPVIKVNTIDVIGVSASSVIHIGSSKQISMESRLKHVRQLLPKE